MVAILRGSQQLKWPTPAVCLISQMLEMECRALVGSCCRNSTQELLGLGAMCRVTFTRPWMPVSCWLFFSKQCSTYLSIEQPRQLPTAEK